MIDWHDLRYLLAIGRGSSLAEAARRLRVDPSTISRRLAALESGLGVPIFDRSGGKIDLTEVGEALFTQAIAIEEGIDALSQSAAAAAGVFPVPTVRVTAVPIIANRLLAPALPALYAHSTLLLDLIADGGNARFDRHDVDIALRFGRPKRGAALVRRVADVEYAAYQRRGGASDMGWIAFDRDLEHLSHAETIAALGERDGVAMVVRDAETMLAAARAGVGRALLPCFAADREEDLVRLRETGLSRELWLVAHQSSRDQSSVKAVIEWLDDVLAVLGRT